MTFLKKYFILGSQPQSFEHISHQRGMLGSDTVRHPCITHSHAHRNTLSQDGNCVIVLDQGDLQHLHLRTTVADLIRLYDSLVPNRLWIQ
jgi:hypothetical protein